MPRFAAPLLCLLIISCSSSRPDAAGDPDKEEFLKVVRQNADDPANLEIVSWGEKKNGQRPVTFRCKLVGTVPAGSRANGEVSGSPVMLESCVIAYKDGRIGAVALERTGRVWSPRK